MNLEQQRWLRRVELRRRMAEGQAAVDGHGLADPCDDAEPHAARASPYQLELADGSTPLTRPLLF